MDRYYRTNYARIGLGLVALAAIARLWLIERPSLPPLGLSLLAVIGVAVAANFPIALRRGEITLAHMIGLGAALVHDPIAAAGLAGLGLLIGDAARATARGWSGFRDLPRLERAGLTSLDFAQLTLTTLAAGRRSGNQASERSAGRYAPAFN